MTDQERPGFGDDDMVLVSKQIAVASTDPAVRIEGSPEQLMPSSTSWESYHPSPGFLPFWAERKAYGQLDRGAQLCTRDGRRIGNAWLMGSRKMEEPARTVYMIYTDIGTKLLLSDREIGELFYPPSWIGNQEALNEVRQSAARKAQRL